MTFEDVEKISVLRSANVTDNGSQEDEIHEFKESVGYEVNVDSAEGNDAIKLANDGQTRLIPQPSEDPADPLNWSQRKKNLILFVVAFAALLPDYGSATGAVSLIPQAEYDRSTTSNMNMIAAHTLIDE